MDELFVDLYAASITDRRIMVDRVGESGFGLTRAGWTREGEKKKKETGSEIEIAIERLPGPALEIPVILSRG